MRKLVLIPLFLFFLITGVASQDSLNVSLLSTVFYPQGCNDIWTWVDPSGKEYAILGTETGTAIIDLEDPENPEEVIFIPGTNTTWRDMKSWENHVYVVADNVPDGILIVDMSMAPDSFTWNYWIPEIQVGSQLGMLQSCHNIYIDEKGVAFLAGCNVGNGGVIMFDVDANPKEPVLLGAEDARYSHDCYARGDTLWSADIYEGIFSVWDVSDPSTPVELATQPTTSLFTHNVWLSDDGNTLFTTDERANAFLEAYDVSDLGNIRLLDKFQPAATAGTGVIPHNAHFFNGYVVVSWYTDGFRIIDAHRPENMVEVGYYDTSTDFSDGFNGNWGATPYLPSGLALASDRENGLFVLDPEYKRASYLEGKILNAEDGSSVSGATVVIDADQSNKATSASDGEYKTGLATPGTYDVRVEAIGFYPTTVTVDISTGNVTQRDIELQPLESFAFSGIAIQALDGTPVEGVKVLLKNENFTYTSTTDADGTFQVDEVFIGTYELFAVKWGLESVYIEEINFQDDQSVQIEMTNGYEDDFFLDLGWQVERNALRGNWERGEPIGTGFAFFQVSPEFDVDDDLGEQCYVTGNGGLSAGFDDVDGGSTLLSSPAMDLTTYIEPVLSFQYWFMNVGGNGEPDDSLEVFISNGVDTVKIFNVAGEESQEQWVPVEGIKIRDYFDDPGNVKVHFYTYDLLESQLVEAGIDAFEVKEEVIISVDDPVEEEKISMIVQPNPANAYFEMRLQWPSAGTGEQLQHIAVFDSQSNLVEERQCITGCQPETMRWYTADWPKGLYFLQLRTQSGKSLVKKIIIH